MALRYNPPPGWQVPRGDWRPPFDWEPEPSWPPAPPGWSFWLDGDQEAKHRPRPGSRRKHAAVLAIVALLGVGAAAKALDSGKTARTDPGSTSAGGEVQATNSRRDQAQDPARDFVHDHGGTVTPVPTTTAAETKVKVTATAQPTSRPATTTHKPVRRTAAPTTTAPVVRSTVPNPVRHTVPPG
jgi:hypothetical protein